MRSTVTARLQWALLSALVVVGCTPQANFDSALLAKVSVPSAAASRCVRLVVRPDSGAEASTGPIAVKPELSIAVYRANGWSTGVTLIARGYPSCDAAADLNAHVEQSAEVKATFPGSGTETVQLALIVKPADADNDNRPAGPDDCNDNDATVYRGAPEQCTDTVDRNCSTTTGCADLTCLGACGDNGLGQCVAGLCKATTEVSCIDGQDNDGDNKVDCADSDCVNVACDDKTACTTGEKCNGSGQCGGGTTTVCNSPPGACFDGAGSCNALDGGCTYAVRTGSCNDQSACTGNDSCQADGGCEGTPAVVCATPPGQCYEATGACIPADAGCTYAVRTGPCDDSSACTTGETCQSNGSCGAPTGTVTCASPPNGCFAAAGTCNPTDGACSYALRPGNNTSCDDGNACTVADRCLADGGCANPTSMVSCAAPPGPCFEATGTCDPSDGGCSYAVRTGSCDDGDPCTTAEQCLADGGCGTGSAVVCSSPPSQCHGSAGTCQSSDGACTYPVLTGNSCNDGSACTSGESCQSDGTCRAPTSTVSCSSPPTQCFNPAGSCNPLDGGCTYAPKGGNSPCDDDNACTTGERCVPDGGCANATSTVTCTTPPGQCFAATGTCNPTDASCSYAPRTGSCDDADPCTTGEQCLADGGCGAGAAVVCDTPPSQCFAATGTCQPSDGTCAYFVRTGACDDSSACTSGEQCLVDGGCGNPASVVTCAPPAQCFDAGVCNPATGSCQYPAAAAGDPCNDGNLCNTGDQCNGSGTCTPGTTPVTCTAPNPCFDGGSCSPATGCPASAPMPGAVCSDTDPCTLGETCSGAGVCTPASTTTCTPNECQTAGTCLADAGCSFSNRMNGFNCNSGDGDCYNGVCVTPVPFPYSPSNFTPDATKAISHLTIDCALTFSTDGVTPTFTPCRSTETATVEVITQSGSSVGAVVLHVAKLTVTSGGSLTVTGGRPLIIAVYGDADVAGMIDVSANLAASGAGAGLNCPPGTPTNGSKNGSGNGGSGAGGGGSVSNGGNGGQGDGTSTVGAGGANNGNNPSLTPIVGGCRGAVGGVSSGTGAAGGGGGGAVQISVAGALRVTGTLAAAGGGGAAGVTVSGDGTGGGGGGGAGGILLEANALTLRSTARVTANGGAGGEGGAGNGGVSANGGNGTKDTRTAATNTGTSNGANGGAGGAGATLNGANGSSAGGGNNGGGGGGGAAGRVRLNGASRVCRETNHVVSPSSAGNLELSPAFTISSPVNDTLATCP